MDDVIDSINRLRRPNIEGRYFIPEKALYGVVRATLKRCEAINIYELDHLAGIVYDGGRKTLGILLLDRHVRYIKKFVEGDQYQVSKMDDKLPVELQKLEKFMEPVHAQLFQQRQWEITSPVFSESILRRQLEDQTILPFIRDTYIGHGGFGTVYEIHLDAEQNMFSKTYQKVLIPNPKFEIMLIVYSSFARSSCLTWEIIKPS